MAERWYTIGSFTFPASWVAIIASFILTYVFLYFWSRKTSDWYSDGVFYFLLIWKLSVLVVDFQMVIKHPITILYFHGGMVGYWLGIMTVLFYIFFKKTAGTSYLVFAWISTVAFYELVAHLLGADFLVAVTQFVINGGVTLFLLKKIKGSDRDTWAVQLVVVFTLLQLFFHSMYGDAVFTTVTWTYLLVMIYLIFFYVRRKHNE
ncbi:hypothetical protein CN378_11115 [Bacillus sp. AFS015802]|uniref:hypothetical protein n=1 Tax=Bacillus sp. AFS015802 TaxID=2033486 RepID=UPI000BF57438|nr:hypothetical protein [Bacillus sp. AFS015802]PFA67388.1 hypothetical protein CN378_11115 [Bacillus sp. AFS015802]